MGQRLYDEGANSWTHCIKSTRLPCIDILLLAISAVLSGAEGLEDIEDFGHLKLDWLKKYGTFKEGIPRHDTIARVICRLKADYILELKGNHSGMLKEL